MYPENRNGATPKPKRREVAAYQYLDSTGREVFQKVRYVVEGNGRDKSFAYRYAPRSDRELARARYVVAINGRLYAYGKPQGADDLLYHLPEVLEAKESEPVYWAEGEKDADALRSAGVVATSHHGGAGAVYAAQCAHLNGAQRLVIVADRDVPGAYDALLRFTGCRSQVAAIELVKARAGKDAADHLSSGYGVQELVFVPVEKLREVAERYTPPELARSLARAGYNPELAEMYREMAAFWAANPDFVLRPIVESSRPGKVQQLLDRGFSPDDAERLARRMDRRK